MSVLWQDEADVWYGEPDNRAKSEWVGRFNLQRVSQLVVDQRTIADVDFFEVHKEIASMDPTHSRDGFCVFCEQREGGHATGCLWLRVACGVE